MSNHVLNRSCKTWHKSREEGSKAVDVSHLVSSFEVSAKVGGLPSATIAFLWGNMDDKTRSLVVDSTVSNGTPVKLQRNDLIAISQVTEDSPGDPIEDVLIVGEIVDFMYARGSSSLKVGVQIETPLAVLDSTTVSDLVAEKINSDGFITTKVLNGELRGTIKDVLEKEVKSDVVATNGYINDSMLGVYYTAQNRDGTVYIKPWSFVRQVLRKFLEYTLNSYTGPEYGDTNQDVLEKINGLLYKIDEQTIRDKPCEIGLSTTTYRAFASYVIDSVLTLSDAQTSLWSVISGLLQSLHLVFSPRVVFKGLGQASSNYILGEFISNNPYQSFIPVINSNIISSMSPQLANHNNLVKSVVVRLNDGSAYTNYSDNQLMDGRITLSGDSWLLQDDNIGYSTPDYGKAVPVSPPKFLVNAYTTIEALEENDTIPVPRRDNNRDTSEEPDVSKRKLELELRSFSVSSLLYLGRRNCTLSTELVTLVDGLQPAKVALIETGAQHVTGVVASLQYSWQQGDRTAVNVVFSHVTSLYDPYYRAVDNSIFIPAKDNFDFAKDEELI